MYLQPIKNNWKMKSEFNRSKKIVLIQFKKTSGLLLLDSVIEYAQLYSYNFPDIHSFASFNLQRFYKDQNNFIVEKYQPAEEYQKMYSIIHTAVVNNWRKYGISVTKSVYRLGWKTNNFFQRKHPGLAKISSNFCGGSATV